MEGKKVHLTVNELVQGTHVYSISILEECAVLIGRW